MMRFELRSYFVKYFNAFALITRAQMSMPNGRQHHNPTLEERFAQALEAPKDADSVEARAHRMKAEAGKKFYAQRKSTVEPVFGIIKLVSRKFSN